MKKVLIPYFNIGLGHFAFARSIKRAFESLPEPWEVRLMDLGEEMPGDLLSKMYVENWKTILAAPRAVKSFLFGINKIAPWTVSLGIARGNRKSRKDAAVLLRESGADVVVACHWGAAHVFNAARKDAGLDLPLYYVYGEVAGIVPQIRSGADTYFYMTEEAREALLGIGVRGGQLVEIGFVLQPGLEQELPDAATSRKELGLAADRFTVLVAFGGEGIGNAYPFLDFYYAHGGSNGAQVLVLTGKNKRFYDELSRRYPQASGRPRIVPAGYIPDIRTAYAAASVLAGKCGASFAMEAVRYRRPLFVIGLGAPNEAHNRDYIVNHGYGFYVPKPAEFARRIDRFVSDEGAYLSALKAFTSTPPHGGAEDIARYVAGRNGAQ